MIMVLSLGFVLILERMSQAVTLPTWWGTLQSSHITFRPFFLREFQRQQIKITSPHRRPHANLLCTEETQRCTSCISMKCKNEAAGNFGCKEGSARILPLCVARASGEQLKVKVVWRPGPAPGAWGYCHKPWGRSLISLRLEHTLICGGCLPVRERSAPLVLSSTSVLFFHSLQKNYLLKSAVLKNSCFGCFPLFISSHLAFILLSLTYFYQTATRGHLKNSQADNEAATSTEKHFKMIQTRAFISCQIFVFLWLFWC